MDLDEIESELIRLGKEESRLAILGLDTSKIDDRLQEVYDEITHDQYWNLCPDARGVLESYGLDDDVHCVPYHEGWT